MNNEAHSRVPNIKIKTLTKMKQEEEEEKHIKTEKHNKIWYKTMINYILWINKAPNKQHFRISTEHTHTPTFF